MLTPTSMPIIFLAFANDRSDTVGYLRNLPEEARRLQTSLARADQSNLCTVIVRQNATLEDILGVFQNPRYRDRIAIFHYGGHADGYHLLLETEKDTFALAHASGLAAFLAQQKGLHLVFLNGCSTQQQVQGLLDAGVAAVIATSQAIDDTVAANFARSFYQGLAGGATVQGAFNEAEAAIQAAYGKEMRHLYYAGANNKNQPVDRWPWALYQRDGSDLAGSWSLPLAAGDPLFGLPPLPALDLPEQPFRHLQWFRRADASIFFGQGQQLRDLYTRITDTKGAPLILLYGQSGVGKSSLLAAGLLPRLEQEQTVLYLRRVQQPGLLNTLLDGLPSLVSTAPAGSEQPDTHTATSTAGTCLRDRWLAYEAATGKPLTLILDQVEELYTRPQGEPQVELTAFLDALTVTFADRNRRPCGKLILGFRKEWLAELKMRLVERELPRAEVFLERLDREGIIEAVTGVASVPALRQHYGLTLQDGLAEEIADDLLIDHGSAIAPTLQVLLSKLWERAKKRDETHPAFDQELYHQLRSEGLLLSDFLDQQLTTLGKEQPAAVNSGLALDLLVFHTTPLGTAEQRVLSELRTTFRHQEQTLPSVLAKCRDLYLLVDQAENQSEVEPASRLAHDTLGPLVRFRFDHSDKPGQRARRIIESRAVDWQNGNVGAPLDEADLRAVEAGISGMRVWTEAETQLVAASRKARQKRNRLRLLPWIAGILLLLYIVISEQLVNIRRDIAQIGESRSLAAQALIELETDPVKSMQQAAAALPIDARRPYVAEAEFAYSEALQQNWERQRAETNTALQTVNQVAYTEKYLALGGDNLSLITLPDLHLITLMVDAPRILGVSWSKNGMLLSYDSAGVILWHEAEGRSFRKSVPKDEFPSDTGNITCAEWHPGGNQIAICQGNTLWIWQLTTDTLEKVYEFPAAIVGDLNARHARWSPSGQWLIAWDEDQTVLLWDSQGGGSAIQSGVHTERIWDVVWSSDEQTLVTISGDRTAKIWSMPQLQNTHTLTLTVVAQGASRRVDSAGIKFIDNHNFITWGFDSIVRQWDIEGAQHQSYDARTGIVSHVEIRPGIAQMLIVLEDGTTQLWDWAAAEQLATFTGHQKRVWTVAWRGEHLATAGIDGTARIWDTNTGDELARLIGHQIKDKHKDVLWVAWQDDQHLLTVGRDGTLRRWRFVNGHDPFCADWGNAQPPACYGLSHVLRPSDGRSIVESRWVSDTRIVSVDRRGGVRLWMPVQSNLPVWELPQVKGRKVRLNPNGVWMFTYNPEGEGDQQAGQVWKLTEPKPAATPVPGPINTGYWLQDHLLIGRKFLSSLLIDLTTGTMVELGDRDVTYTAAQLTANYLVTADTNNRIRIWNATTGGELWQWEYHDDGTISQLGLLEQGKQVVMATDTGAVSLRDAHTGEVQWPFHAPRATAVKSLAISPDERWIAVAIGQSFLVLDATSGEVSWRQDDPSYFVSGVQWVTRPEWARLNPYRALAYTIYRQFAEDPRRLANPQLLLMTWGGDGEVHFWHADAHVEVLRLRERLGENKPSVNVTAFNRDQSSLLTAGDSGEIRIWQLWFNQPESLLGVLDARRNE